MEFQPDIMNIFPDFIITIVISWPSISLTDMHSLIYGTSVVIFCYGLANWCTPMSTRVSLGYTQYPHVLHLHFGRIHATAAESWQCFVIRSHVWGCTGILFRFCLSSFCLEHHQFNFPVPTQYPHVLYFHFGRGHEAATESWQGFVCGSHAPKQLWNSGYSVDLMSVTSRPFIYFLDIQDKSSNCNTEAIIVKYHS